MLGCRILQWGGMQDPHGGVGCRIILLWQGRMQEPSVRWDAGAQGRVGCRSPQWGGMQDPTVAWDAGALLGLRCRTVAALHPVSARQARIAP